jgi:hypothetical protein
MKHFTILLLIFGITYSIQAQDPRERLYNYQVLRPSHTEKPKVEGWAKERVTEKINRGVVAIKSSNGIYVSWRLLESDPENVSFDVYVQQDGKKPNKLNEKPIKSTTDYLIESEISGSFFVKALNGKEVIDESEKAKISASTSFKTIKFNGDYSPDRIAVGDLNGDGEYDFVIKQPRGRVDPGVWRKSPETSHASTTRPSESRFESRAGISTKKPEKSDEKSREIGCSLCSDVGRKRTPTEHYCSS